MQADPSCMRNADRLYSETKILESRLDQIIYLLETIARKPKEEMADVER